MLIAIAAIALLSLAFGLLLGYSSIRFRVEGDPIVEKIEALLPQTQCGQCSFPGCRAYAEALANDQAEINACP
ncbi:MAG: RnfABCDGE type electron transport complex subunit B, partial [Sedimenticola sp.]|nr:RnfABCDGE type electron transport complex subunit B [Sedimenticola sp.]